VPLTVPPSAAPNERPLDTVLRPIHEAWLEEARRFLAPSIEPGADFWTRWGAIRYLSDQFGACYRLERAMVDELRRVVPAETADRLAQEGDLLVRRRLELDRIGRRRGTAEDMAVGTQGLLEQLGHWLQEIELAAASVSWHEPPAAAAALLRHFETNRPPEQ
jgi:hypothetical protein